MAPKKSSKSRKSFKILDYKSLALNDVLCPICRSVLIEPVTLPCQHGFCSSCFDATMENANLVCPLCRIRIGSWLRKARKDGNLVNTELWAAIKETFPQQVKNKINGVDENLEEEHEIIVSYPGEIRKEYEIQKQKVDTEYKIQCAADIKASEELIKKIKEEEEYEQTVREEKLKHDEEVAKKLAEEMALTSPSTSNIKPIAKKVGPIDKFLRLERAKSQSTQKVTSNFETKEYTCRVLCLDSSKKAEIDPKKEVSPIIKKKIQQIQKIVDTGATSDSSDCIESELRYFKPIDHRLIPPSHGKPPLKVPSRKPVASSSPKIVPPVGEIKFYSNPLESAFARISFPLPTTCTSENSNSNSPQSTNTANSLKRPLSSGEVSSSKRKNKGKVEYEHDDKESPTLVPRRTSKTKRQLFDIRNNTIQKESSSPPFYGFESSDIKKITSNAVNVRQNGINNRIMEDEKSKKRLQEMADLEFAKKLQNELNRDMHFTRSTRKSITSSRRQTTLEEIIKAPRRVK